MRSPLPRPDSNACHDIWRAARQYAPGDLVEYFSQRMEDVLMLSMTPPAAVTREYVAATLHLDLACVHTSDSPECSRHSLSTQVAVASVQLYGQPVLDTLAFNSRDWSPCTMFELAAGVPLFMLYGYA